MIYHKAVAKLKGQDVYYNFNSGLVETETETDFYITECGLTLHYGHIADDEKQVTCENCKEKI